MIVLRRFGTNKKNPNPPWPNERPSVVVPPGSGAKAIGMTEENVTVMTEDELRLLNRNQAINEREFRREPIMGNMQNQVRPRVNINNEICGNMNVSSYLCNQIGKYVKIEFLFGENMHMEKIGLLKGVGKDFVAVQETGTDTVVVCSLNKIKFINIYSRRKES